MNLPELEPLIPRFPHWGYISIGYADSLRAVTVVKTLTVLWNRNKINMCCNAYMKLFMFLFVHSTFCNKQSIASTLVKEMHILSDNQFQYTTKHNISIVLLFDQDTRLFTVKC